MLSLITNSLYRNSLKSIRNLSITSEALKKKSIKKETIDVSEIDITVTNDVNSKYTQQFLKIHALQRPDFQADEFEQRKKAFGDDFSVLHIFKKGTVDLIYSLQVIKMRSLLRKNDFFNLVGVAWIPEKYRGSKSLWFRIAKLKGAALDTRKVNMVACTVDNATKLYALFTDLKKFEHVMVTNVSFYNIKDFINPNLKFDEQIVLKDKNEVDFNDVIKYDQSIFPYERSKYIEMLFDHPDNYSKIALDKNGKIIGFGVVVVNPSGECVINPLYADNKQIAQSIFQSILKKMPLNSPKINKMRIRCNDRCEFSHNWIDPFIQKPLETNYVYELVYTTQVPTDFDFSKVASSSHPTTCPI